MAQLWPLLAGLLVLLGTNINLAGAGTCKPTTCSQTGGSGLFKYTAGHTYVYNLEGKTHISLPEQQGEPIQVELKADAEVNFGAECTNTLQLKNVQVTGPNAKVYGDLKDLEAHPVRFSFVESEICADAADSNTALNIKRAVISLLQVSVGKSSQKREVDVFGSCPTTFRVDGGGAETTIHKSRDLSKCTYREDLRNRVPTSTYATHSDLQSAPILDSNQVVEVNIKDGIIKKAHSHEIYLYRPFSNQDAGAKTVVHTTLTLVSHAAQPAHNCKADAPRSIIFESPHGDSNSKSSSAKIIAALQGCQALSSDSVKFASATEFRHLVDVFRTSKKDDLLAVFQQVKAGAGFPNKEAARKLFLDALFRSGNGDSIQVAGELLKAKEFSDGIARLWYMSFAFARHVSPAALASAASLLEEGSPSEAYLGVGALGSRYCHEHTCDGLKEYDLLLSKMSKPLTKGCKCSSYEEENKVIAALKGLENMKGVNEATAALISKCMAAKDVPARVRVVAIETARSASCQPELKSTALAILQDIQEDSEIRIKAYLTCVECACGKCANIIKQVLDAEPVNQVGSFIVSHLRNVRATTNPERARQKEHLSQISTTRKFPFDFRKFSRNYEFSGLLDAINVGSSVEANVIFSQQSYLPRSKSFNLTTEIFGHSVNLLEIGTRAQNLDRFIESIVGPRGYLNTHDLSEVFTNSKSKLKELREKLSSRFSKSMRNKRSVPTSALEAFRKTVYQPTERRDMDLDLNVKMFGTTLLHKSYHGDGHDLSCDHIVDKLFDSMDKGVNGAKNFNYDLKHHAIFYENEVVYPTGLGFPLKMLVTGTAAVALKLDGKIDLHSILKDPKNAHLQFELMPSATVEVVGMMSVDGYAVEAGLKTSSNLHTTTGINVNIKSIDGLGFDMSLGLPVKKQEILHVQSEILSSVQERGSAPEEKALSFNTKRKEFQGCFDTLSPVLGLTFCSEVGIPLEGQKEKAALFPLNGPSKFILTVEAEDVQTYKMKAALNLRDEDRRAIELLIDTPGSKTNRKVEVILEALRKPNLEIRAKFSSPIKSLSAELVRVKTAEEISLMGKITEDNNEYFLKVGADISGSENHKTYVPSIEYSSGSPKAIAKGKGKGKSSQTKNQGVKIEGSVTIDHEGSSCKITFNNIILHLPVGTVGVNGFVHHQDPTISTDLKIVHNSNSEFAVTGKAELLGPSHVKVKGAVQASQYPDFSGSVDWEFNKAPEQFDTKLVLVHGKDLNSDQARITAVIATKCKGTSYKDVDAVGEAKLTYPLLGVLASVHGDIKPNGVSYEVEGKYDKYDAKSDGHFKVGVHKPRDYDIKFEAKVLENHVLFESKRDIQSPIESKFVTKLEMTPGGKHELIADTIMQFDPDHVHHKVAAVLKTEGQPEPYNLEYGLEVTNIKFDGHFKAHHGKTEFANAVAKVNKGPKPSGVLKAVVPNLVDASLEFSLDPKVKGSIEGYVKLLKLKRTLSTKGTMTVTGSVHTGVIDIILDATDPKHTIHFETVSDVTLHALDSKNKLVVFGYETLFNVKGKSSSMHVSIKDRVVDMGLEGSGDITLPNKVFLTGALDLNINSNAKDFDGIWKLQVSAAEKQGAPTRSLIIDAKADKCDKTRGYFDTDFNMVFKDIQGKDFKYHFAGKHLPDGEKRHVELLGQIQGSLLDMAPMAHVKVDIEKPTVNYVVKVNLAADSNLELVGKAQNGISGTVPYTLDNALEVNLPTGELKNIKASQTLTFVKGVKGAPCETKGTLTATYNGVKTVKLDADIKAGTENGQAKLTISMPGDELRVIKGTYTIASGPGIDREITLAAINGAKEGNVKIKIKVPVDRQSMHIEINGATPFEKYKTFGLVADGARKDSIMESEATFTLNEKKAVVTSKYGLDWKAPLISVSIVHPSGKSGFSLHYLPKPDSSNHHEAEISYEHNGDSGFIKTDVMMPSVNDFRVVLDADAPKFKVNKLHLEIANTPGVKGGKTISVKGTEEGQPIEGALNYKYKDGSDGGLFEATGSVNVKGQTREAKIAVKKNVLSTAAETGIEYTITSVLGERTIDAFFKQSTKEIHLKLKGCQNAGACGNAEYHAKLHIEGLDFSSEMEASVDTTGLGLNTAVGLRRVTVKKGLEFNHQVDFTSKGKTLVTFKIGFSNKASSVHLIFPTRELAAEAEYGLTSDPKNNKHYIWKYGGSVWLDKTKEPENKATGLIEVDYLRTDDSITISSESKFAHPSLGKDMVVKGAVSLGGRQTLDARIEIDVFAKPGQKITIDGKVGKSQIANGYNYTSTWVIKSKGHGLDISSESHVALTFDLVGFGSTLVYKDDKTKKDMGIGYEGGLKRSHFFIKAPNAFLIDASRDCKWGDTLPSAEFYLAVAGCGGVVGKIHLEEGGRILYSIHKKATPNRKIAGESVIDYITKMHTSLDWYTPEKKELYSIGVNLDEKITPEVTISFDHLKTLVGFFRDELKEFVAKAKSVSNELKAEAEEEFLELVENLKKSSINIKPLIAAYQTQLKAIRKEFTNQQSTKELANLVKQYSEPAAEVFGQIVEVIAQIADKALGIFEEFANAVIGSLKRIMPRLTEATSKIFSATADLFALAGNQVLNGLQKLIELGKEHETEIKDVLNGLADVARTVYGAVGKTLGHLCNEIKDFVSVIADQIKSLPMFSMLKERCEDIKQQLQELFPTDTALRILQEVTHAVKDLLPTAELREFVEYLSAHLAKLMKHEKVDHSAESKKLYHKMVAGYKSIIHLIRSEKTTKGTDTLTVIGSAWQHALKSLFKLPRWASIHLSPFRYMQLDDLPSLQDYIVTYTPTTLNPHDIIPPFRSFAMIMGASSFLTFDKRPFKFTGTCSYILTQDVINGNFSLVLNLDNGKFKSIQLDDGHDIVEITKQQTLLVNGKPSEYPFQGTAMAAWRQYHSVELKAHAGLRVSINFEYGFSMVQLDGFYHGQVRGLLGDSNYEQYDDFRLPNGKVTTDAAEFGNSYQVGGACAPGTAASAPASQHEAECTTMFSANSPLRPAFMFVNPEPFRDACDQAVSQTTKKQVYACRFAASYVKFANQKGMKVSVPHVCATCDAPSGKMAIDEVLSVKVPSQKADIVIVLEQVTSNAEIYKELVAPLVQSLTNDLKGKGISDVVFSLIGFGHPKHYWPSHHTSQGQMVFDGKANLEFGEAESFPTTWGKTKDERWDYLKRKFQIEVGKTKFSQAIVEASQYPFRAGAARTVLLVMGSRCEKGLDFGLQKLRLFLAEKVAEDRGVQIHVISPMDGFNIMGVKDQKALKTVVGFDSDVVYSFQDGKKKSLDGVGNADQRRDVEYSSDICIDVSQKTDGAAFNAHNFIDGNANQRKNFLQLVTNKLAESLTTELAEECKCTLFKGLYAESRCKVTDRKLSEPLKQAESKTKRKKPKN